jgi:hypothetical protein
MVNDAAIKKSLEFRRRILTDFRKLAPLEVFDWYDEARSTFIEGRLRCEPKSLEDAAKFFGFDHSYRPHREILLHLLAQAVFGKHTRGVKKGDESEWWSFGRWISLGIRDRELRRQNPRLSNDKIAGKICETEEEFKVYRRDPNPVRKRLPEARQLLELWESSLGERRALEDMRPGIERATAIFREALKEPRKREFLQAGFKKLLSRGSLLEILGQPGPIVFGDLLSHK